MASLQIVGKMAVRIIAQMPPSAQTFSRSVFRRCPTTHLQRSGTSKVQLNIRYNLRLRTLQQRAVTVSCKVHPCTEYVESEGEATCLFCISIPSIISAHSKEVSRGSETACGDDLQRQHSCCRRAFRCGGQCIPQAAIMICTTGGRRKTNIGPRLATTLLGGPRI